ncbi:MAG: polysaccharide biosynthesis protein [Clostridia bacterium]|nr:polysaccharide biosynthesis protein [Clostridia bacterium]
MATKNRKNLLFSGIVILTVANLLVKVIGLIYKIPLHERLGGEGMGYFNSAYRIYTAFYLVSTGGLPIAVSLMVSEARAKGKKKEVKQIFKAALCLFMFIGASGTAIMMVGSKGLAIIAGNEPASICILAVAPTLFFICICSAIRGYFQGYQNMLPTSISEVLESLGKAVLGILLAIYAAKCGYDVPVIAAYALIGLTLGVFAGTVYIQFQWLFFKHKQYDAEFDHLEDTSSRTTKQLLKTLLITAIPISISASVMSVADAFDSGIINTSLRALGYTKEIANDMWGDYSTLAISMYNMPTVLIYPISASIVPYISSALAERDMVKAKGAMTSSLKIASMIAIPAALGMSVLSGPILSLFFSDTEAVEFVAPLLSVLAVAVFFIGMLSVTNSILQANKLERLPIISMIVGACVKILSTSVLMRIGLGMYGAPLGTVLCYMTIAVINFVFIFKKVGILPDFIAVFVKPFLAVIPCCLAAIGTYFLVEGFHAKIATVLAIMAAVIVYLIALLLLKGITKEEVLMVPKGKKIYALLHKIKLM